MVSKPSPVSNQGLETQASLDTKQGSTWLVLPGPEVLDLSRSPDTPRARFLRVWGAKPWVSSHLKEAQCLNSLKAAKARW